MQIHDISVSQLIEYKNNPRYNDGAVDAVAESIKQFGFKVPIIVDNDYVIVAGHTRLKAARLLGIDKVPCIVADDLTPEQIKAFRLADNKVGELAGWDFTKLEEELSEISNQFDMSMFGFDMSDFKEETEIIEDEAPEVDEEAEPTTKLGDIWQLGRHRLMCGDSTEKSSVLKLLNGERAYLVFTDPPYGVEIVQNQTVSGGKPFGTTSRPKSREIVPATKYMQIKGDDTTDTARLNFEIVKDLSEIQIIFGGNYFTDFLPPSRCWIVWDKGVPEGAFFAPIELAWVSKDGNAKIYKWLWSGLCRKGNRDVEGKKRVHPTQKPVGLIAEILKDFSKENDIVIDCFGGSGSTLIACEQTDRQCYMVEYEPYYCDVIIKRWETLTGEKAVRVE